MLATYKSSLKSSSQQEFITYTWNDLINLIDRYAGLKPFDLPIASKFIISATDKSVIERQEIMIDNNQYPLIIDSILLKYYIELSRQSSSYEYDYIFQRRNIIVQGVRILQNHIIYACMLRAKDFYLEKMKPTPISWISTFFNSIQQIIAINRQIKCSYLRNLEKDYKEHLRLESKVLSEIITPFDIQKHLQLCKQYLTATLNLLQNMHAFYKNADRRFTRMSDEQIYSSSGTVSVYLKLFKSCLNKFTSNDNLVFVFNNLYDSSAEESLIKEEKIRWENILHKRNKREFKNLNDKFNVKCNAVKKITFSNSDEKLAEFAEDTEELDLVENFIKSLSAKVNIDAKQLLSIIDDVSILQAELNKANKHLSNKEAMAIAECLVISFASTQTKVEESCRIAVLDKIKELSLNIDLNSLDGLRLQLLLADFNQTIGLAVLKQLSRNKFKLVEFDKRGYLKIVATVKQI